MAANVAGAERHNKMRRMRVTATCAALCVINLLISQAPSNRCRSESSVSGASGKYARLVLWKTVRRMLFVVVFVVVVVLCKVASTYSRSGFRVSASAQRAQPAHQDSQR